MATVTPDLMGLLAAAQQGARRDTLEALALAIDDRLADTDEKRRVGERLRVLREHSPYTQEGVADEIGVTLRAYQKMEQTGGVKFPNLVKIAKLFGVDVSHFYEKPETEGGRLDRIERKLDAVMRALAATNEQIAAELRAELQALDDARAGKSTDSTSTSQPAPDAQDQ